MPARRSRGGIATDNKRKRGRSSSAAADRGVSAEKRKKGSRFQPEKEKEPKAEASRAVAPESETSPAYMAEKPIALETGWGEMEKGINKLKRLLEGEKEESFSAEQYMNLYTIIYNMCTQKPPHDFSEALYIRYKEAFIRYISDKVLPSLRDQRELLLQELLKRWSNHMIMVRWLSRFFNYLDRFYVSRHSKPSLREVGLTCFKDEVYSTLHSRAKDAVLAAVQREREGELVDRALLKNVLAIFIEVGMGEMEVYDKDFEAFLLVETSCFYQKAAAAWIQEDSCPEYLRKAEDCLRAEEERVEGYLHTSSKSKLLQEVEGEVLAKYETQLLEKENSGCAVLLKDDKKEDLGRLFRLFQRVEHGLHPVADTFRKHVECEGLKLVKDASEAAAQRKESNGKPVKDTSSGEQQFVSCVIELHDKYLEYVQVCFHNDSAFHKALKEAFESFCNKAVAGTTFAELMANFCNNLLKKGGADKMSEEEIEQQLDKVVKLLAYISDKDMFSEFYRKKLARRLLQDFSSSDELERSILSRLKQQCGAQFTSKMEGMVNDLQLAKEKHQHFMDWKETHEKQLPYDLVVSVLTTGFWPTYKSNDLALPQEMIDGITLFKEVYEANTKHRKLTWIYSLGSCSLKANFPKKTLELVLMPFQATIMLLFNSGEELSYAEIKEATNLADEDLMRALHSLSCAKFKVLEKQPASKTISRQDRFQINPNFTDKARRIKIPMPPQDERKKVVEDVDKDRKHAIDAAIVRTMKSRKVLAHQQLVMEVVQQLQRMFQPDFRLIKKRIEDLINREYLERDMDSQSTYKYVA